MITFTEAAALKAKDIISPGSYLRIGVRGGGCSGFMYSMEAETETRPMDTEHDFFGLKVLTDAISSMYLKDCTVDFVETLEESGFKFINPNATTTCGCGKSFA